ncbi:ABC transporter ATP-binding protein [Candidatus Woesearchaeota archaeon]|nr:ABC transporter ATP-binding protein [Candidatus Woesearchaeota archaeon]
MSEPIFKVRNVSKAFGKNLVLNNISFDIYKGEILGIIGASGSGKTTILNTLIGFLKPEKGEVLFKTKLQPGIPANYRSVLTKQDTVKHLYGFAAQVPSFQENLTVKENLEYFGSLYNLSKTAIQKNSTILIKLMNLQMSANTVAKILSGGMERRLDIACSLIHNPPVLILDEPTADLDPVLRDHIWDIIDKINRNGTTIVLASHHLIELESLCSRIAFLKDGKILHVGSPEELKIKVANFQEILLETYPGDYKKIIENIDEKYIMSKRIIGNKLIIRTKNVGPVLKTLLDKMQENKETIVDINVSKQSLDDVFKTLTKKQK